MHGEKDRVDVLERRTFADNFADSFADMESLIQPSISSPTVWIKERSSSSQDSSRDLV